MQHLHVTCAANVPPSADSSLSFRVLVCHLGVAALGLIDAAWRTLALQLTAAWAIRGRELAEYGVVRSRTFRQLERSSSLCKTSKLCEAMLNRTQNADALDIQDAGRPRGLWIGGGSYPR
jgi:hypothetical protein